MVESIHIQQHNVCKAITKNTDNPIKNGQKYLDGCFKKAWAYKYKMTYSENMFHIIGHQ